MPKARNYNGPSTTETPRMSYTHHLKARKVAHHHYQIQWRLLKLLKPLNQHTQLNRSKYASHHYYTPSTDKITKPCPEAEAETEPTP
jgi:hypothetical protein